MIHWCGSYAVRSPYRHRGGWGNLSAPMIDQYEEGTLIIDVLDGQNRQLMWRGADSRRLGRAAPQQEEIRKSVEQILAEFPPAG